jgi:hypothetical protein
MWFYVARPTQHGDGVIVVGHYPDAVSAVQAAAGGIIPYQIVEAATDDEATAKGLAVYGLG